MRNNNFVWLFSAFFTALFGISCSNEYQIEPFDYKAEYDRVSKTKSSEVKNRKDIELSDLAQRKSNYRYSAVGKKDPFRSYFGDVASLNKDKEIVSELQKFDVTDLRLTAIIWGVTEPRVVIVAPDGKSYIVKGGSFIGKNWGKISRILPDKIEIIETYKDPLGRKILNKLYLELPIKTILQESAAPVEDQPLPDEGKTKKNDAGKDPAENENNDKLSN
ncbi:MAG TPA: pilus assembly protein PilP [bacterium]|nr:pilus assembly protein PilP [bacterium]